MADAKYFAKNITVCDKRNNSDEINAVIGGDMAFAGHMPHVCMVVRLHFGFQLNATAPARKTQFHLHVAIDGLLEIRIPFVQEQETKTKKIRRTIGWRPNSHCPTGLFVVEDRAVERNERDLSWRSLKETVLRIKGGN